MEIRVKIAENLDSMLCKNPCADKSLTVPIFLEMSLCSFLNIEYCTHLKPQNLSNKITLTLIGL